MNTGIIILAAGSSSRLGKPKQLLTYQGKTLLSIVSDAAVGTGFEPIVVVLGSSAQEIGLTHQNSNIDYALNNNWQNGISSSITTGILRILELQPAIENIIITVADQVFISGKLFEDLNKQQEITGKGIVASTYSQTMGTPALFNKKYFQHLLALSGDAGAKAILKLFPSDIGTVAFDQGDIDIDTEGDYDNLNRNS